MINNQLTSQSFLILLWNSNGLYNHKDELLTTLHEKNIDIALISETHFTEHSKISFPGYRVIHTNHPDNSAHAGAAIIFKSSLKSYPLPEFKTASLQSASIKIILNHIPISISAVITVHQNTKSL